MSESKPSRLDVLAEELRGLDFFTSNQETVRAQKLVHQALTRLESHLIAREKDLDAPLVAVMAGSTGSGKSTLLNTLVDAQVAAVSAIRPTTARPLLVHHPKDELWFAARRILGNFQRIRIAPDAEPTVFDNTDSFLRDGSAQLEIRSGDGVPRSVALVDVPDLDSLRTWHREQAQDLLSAADLWIFVTTALRYGDALPWSFLEKAAQRKLVVAVVLNRVPTGALLEVKQDLSQRLAKIGLADAPLFTIPEDNQRSDAFLQKDNVEPIRQWLDSLSSDALLRSAVARQSLHGSVNSTLALCEDVANLLSLQDDVVQQASSVVNDACDDACKEMMQVITQGDLLRGEVLARWNELIGTTDLIRGAQGFGQRFFASIERFWSGGLAAVEPVQKAVGHSISTSIVVQLENFFTKVQDAWAKDESTAYLLERWMVPDAESLTQQANDVTVKWQREIVNLLRTQGAQKSKVARRMALGINSIAVAFMLVIFASTAGLTGMEVGVAGACAVVAQKLLEMIFGQQAIDSMVKTARADLLDRFSQLTGNHAKTMLDAIGPACGREQSKRLVELVKILKQEWQ